MYPNKLSKNPTYKISQLKVFAIVIERFNAYK